MAKTLGLTLPLQVGNVGYFQTTTDPQQQVKSNLINLLLTQIGEYPLNPTFGSTLSAQLFELETNTQANVQAAIESAVQTWMPFVSIDNVATMQSTSDYNTNIVNITYHLITNNIPQTISLVI